MRARLPRFKDFLTSDTIAEKFECKPDTVMGWRDQGLRSYRIGKRVWFYEPEVAQFILDHLAREDR